MFTFLQRVRMKHIPDKAYTRTSLGNKVWLEDDFDTPVVDLSLHEAGDIFPAQDLIAEVMRMTANGKVLVHFGVRCPTTLYFTDGFALMHPEDLDPV